VVPAIDYLNTVRFTLIIMLLVAAVFVAACGLRVMRASGRHAKAATVTAAAAVAGTATAAASESASPAQVVVVKAAVQQPSAADAPVQVSRCLQLLHHLHQSLLALLVLFYLRILQLMLEVFQCTSLPDANQPPAVLGAPVVHALYISADRSTLCYTGQMNAVVVCAVLVLVLFTAGLPIAIFRTLMRSMTNERTKGVLGELRRQCVCLRSGGPSKMRRQSIVVKVANHPATHGKMQLTRGASGPLFDGHTNDSTAATPTTANKPAPVPLSREEREARVSEHRWTLSYGFLLVAFRRGAFFSFLFLLLLLVACVLCCVFASASVQLSLLLCGFAVFAAVLSAELWLPLRTWRSNLVFTCGVGWSIMALLLIMQGAQPSAGVVSAGSVVQLVLLLVLVAVMLARPCLLRLPWLRVVSAADLLVEEDARLQRKYKFVAKAQRRIATLPELQHGSNDDWWVEDDPEGDEREDELEDEEEDDVSEEGAARAGARGDALFTGDEVTAAGAAAVEMMTMNDVTTRKGSGSRSRSAQTTSAKQAPVSEAFAAVAAREKDLQQHGWVLLDDEALSRMDVAADEQIVQVEQLQPDGRSYSPARFHKFVQSRRAAPVPVAPIAEAAPDSCSESDDDAIDCATVMMQIERMPEYVAPPPLVAGVGADPSVTPGSRLDVKRAHSWKLMDVIEVTAQQLHVQETSGTWRRWMSRTDDAHLQPPAAQSSGPHVRFERAKQAAVRAARSERRKEEAAAGGGPRKGEAKGKAALRVVSIAAARAAKAAAARVIQDEWRQTMHSSSPAISPSQSPLGPPSRVLQQASPLPSPSMRSRDAHHDAHMQLMDVDSENTEEPQPVPMLPGRKGSVLTASPLRSQAAGSGSSGSGFVAASPPRSRQTASGLGSGASSRPPALTLDKQASVGILRAATPDGGEPQVRRTGADSGQALRDSTARLASWVKPRPAGGEGGVAMSPQAAPVSSPSTRAFGSPISPSAVAMVSSSPISRLRSRGASLSSMLDAPVAAAGSVSAAAPAPRMTPAVARPPNQSAMLPGTPGY